MKRSPGNHLVVSIMIIKYLFTLPKTKSLKCSSHNKVEQIDSFIVNIWNSAIIKGECIKRWAQAICRRREAWSRVAITAVMSRFGVLKRIGYDEIIINVLSTEQQKMLKAISIRIHRVSKECTILHFHNNQSCIHQPVFKYSLPLLIN